MIIYESSNELYHYGVLGMKWGKTLTKKQLDEASNDVIRGKYGNGSDRKKALGEHYSQIQSEVNSKLGKKDSKTSKDSKTDKLAREVIRGKYGNGAARKKKLGSDYKKVQSRVNEILKASKSNKKKVKSINSKKSKSGKSYIAKKIKGR